jgi:hypothetical protein
MARWRDTGRIHERLAAVSSVCLELDGALKSWIGMEKVIGERVTEAASGIHEHHPRPE